MATGADYSERQQKYDQYFTTAENKLLQEIKSRQQQLSSAPSAVVDIDQRIAAATSGSYSNDFDALQRDSQSVINNLKRELKTLNVDDVHR